MNFKYSPLLVLFLSVTLAASCVPKKGTISGSGEKDRTSHQMTRGDVVDYYWIDPDADVSSYSSIHIPDFSLAKAFPKLNWVTAFFPDSLADSFSKLKLFGVIDRSPIITTPWADATLSGKIVDSAWDCNIRCFFRITISIVDNRTKKEVVLIQHTAYRSGATTGSRNPLRELVVKMSKNVAIFFNHIEKYQQKENG